MPTELATLEDSNRSHNLDIHTVSNPRRQVLLQGGLGMGFLASLGGCATVLTPATSTGPSLGFAGIAPSAADRVIAPPGYVAQSLVAWGEPIGAAAGMAAFREDAGNSAAEQALQVGMHHDGMHFSAIEGVDPNRSGLLVMNHEYVDDGLLHSDGLKTWSAEKVKKSQAAHGIGVIEI